jgi:hypothetical protein
MSINLSMTILEDPDAVSRLRRLLEEALQILPAPATEAGTAEATGHRPDWPRVDLSHLSVRKSIQEWLALLPGKRSASPAEIIEGLKAARPSGSLNIGTVQQSIYELWKEGKIRKDGWGQYGALRDAESPNA